VIKSILLNKRILIPALSLAAILVIVKIVEFSFFRYKFSLEVYLGVIASLFLIIGVYFGSKMGKKREIQKSGGTLYNTANSETINPAIETDLSSRELEVLLNISHGLSNKEIADKLFVSLNTIKTHTANIYSKLGVKSRTQAISRAKSLNLIQ